MLLANASPPVIGSRIRVAKKSRENNNRASYRIAARRRSRPQDLMLSSGIMIMLRRQNLSVW